MENKAPFNLNLEIRRWRESLVQSPSFRTGDIDELECHLQDSVGKLNGLGLSEEEAFTLALRRMGSGPALAKEYERVNAGAVWTDRLLWMLLGWASFSNLQSLASLVALSQHPNIIHFLYALALLRVFPWIVAILIVRSLLRSDGRVPRVMTRLLFAPLKLASVFFSLGLVSLFLRFFAEGYVIWGNFRYLKDIQLETLTLPIGTWLVVTALILVLARKRLRTLRA